MSIFKQSDVKMVRLLLHKHHLGFIHWKVNQERPDDSIPIML